MIVFNKNKPCDQDKTNPRYQYSLKNVPLTSNVPGCISVGVTKGVGVGVGVCGVVVVGVVVESSGHG